VKPVATSVEPTTDPGTGIIRWLSDQLVVGNRQELKALALSSLDKNLIIDLSETDYVDASGLGVLVAISHSLRDRGKRLVLVGISEDLGALLELTKMNTLFNSSADVDTALDWLAGREVSDTPIPKERKQYQPYDLLEFDEARDWWGVSARTLERMNLPWSFPTRASGGGRLRRIMFKDLVAHYERRKIG
jgi:anti-sigma B factor antagonist